MFWLMNRKDENKVKIGALVTITDIEKDETETFKIVGTAEIF